MKNTQAMFQTIEPNWQISDKLKVFTTQARGEVATGVYAGFNTANHTGAPKEEVATAREILTQAIQKPINWFNQVHSSQVCESFMPEAEFDAAILRQADYAIGIQTADCLPIVLANKNATEVAILHAGWRGLVAGIIGNTVNKLHSKTSEISVWFAPCISAKNYEVDSQVWQEFITIDAKYATCFKPSPLRIKHYQLDLVEVAKLQLLEFGIDDFYFSNICTFADDRFYSYRRSGITGRNATIAYFTP